MNTESTSTGLSQAEMQSIEQFLGSCTVPLIYQAGDRTFVQGTGTFFKFGDKHYLVTAAHVFTGIDPQELGVPDAPVNAHVWTFGNVTIHYPKDDDFDVAILHLQDEEFCARVSRTWLFLQPKNVAVSPTADNYIVAGYPTETVTKVDSQLVSKALCQLYTGPYDGPVDGGRTQFDFFLRYTRNAKGAFGESRVTPNLSGVSGASVWAFGANSSSFWAPESLLKIVGIQVSFKHSSYVRAKSWALVYEVLRRIDPQAAALIDFSAQRSTEAQQTVAADAPPAARR
jgi:hypothetical protein